MSDEWLEGYDGDCCFGNYDDAHSHGIAIGEHRLAARVADLEKACREASAICDSNGLPIAGSILRAVLPQPITSEDIIAAGVRMGVPEEVARSVVEQKIEAGVDES